MLYDRRTAMIHGIYASTSGNTELVLERIQSTWKANGLLLELHRVEGVGGALILEQKHFILATSTWEHGVINPLFKKVLSEMKTMDLHGKFASIVGCGDRRYEPVLFCEGANHLARVFSERGGEIIGEVLKIDGDPRFVLETEVQAWADLQYDLWRSRLKNDASRGESQ